MATLSSPFITDHRGAQAPGWGQLLRFSALTIPLYAAIMPLGVYVPAILARDFGLSLGVIGVVFLGGQVLNALLDPLSGALSDWTRTRFGRRRPWIAGGGVLFVIGAALLFFPPAKVSASWLMLALLPLYLGWGAMQTPYYAWSGELSDQYHQRTRIATYMLVVTSITLFVSLVLPTLADQIRPGDGRLQLALMGTLVLASALPALVLTLTSAPDHAPLAAPQRFSIGASLRAIFANPLLLRVLASDTSVRTGQGVRAALMVFFVGIYMHRPAWAAGLFLFQYVFGILAGPIWLRIGVALGKHRAAVLGESLQVVINLGLLLATPDRFGLVLALALAQGLAQGSGNLMLRAMVADIADLHRSETGEERTGLYYSVFSLAEKLGGALAIGCALPLVGWLGFHPHGANTPAALHGLLCVFALGPAIGHAISAILLAGFPLDENAHSEIRARLEVADATLVPAE
jgi:GPH family glycoside/pentoside/hexuronide:cation symporter